jgi:hypothetical protein
MGPVHLANIDNWGMQDYVWAGVTKSIAYHLNQLQTSINLDLNDDDLKVFPNPSSDYIEVYCNQPVNNIQLYNINGSLIQVSDNKRLEFEDIQKGLYFIKVSVNGKDIVRKIIKN